MLLPAGFEPPREKCFEIAFSQVLALARLQMFLWMCFAILEFLPGCTQLYVCNRVSGQSIPLGLPLHRQSAESTSLGHQAVRYVMFLDTRIASARFSLDMGIV